MNISKDKLVPFCIALVIPFLVVLKAPGYQPLSFSELSISVLLMLLLGVGVMFPRAKCNNLLFYILISVLIFFHLALAFASDSIVAALASLLLHDRYVLIALITVWMLSAKGEELTVKLLIFVASITAYVSLVKIIGNPSSILTLYGEGGFARESSIFPNPNMYGAYLVTVSLLCLPRIDTLLFKKGLSNFVFILCPFLIMIVMTFSRRAWLAWLIGTSFFFLFKRNKSLGSILAGMLVVGIFIWSSDSATIINRFLLIFDSGYASNSERIDATSEQLKVVLGSVESFLGGAGVGMFGPASELAIGGRWGQIDGYFTQVLLEFGFIGLLLYLLIFIYTLIRGGHLLNAIPIPDETYNKTLASLIALTILYFMSIVGSTPITFPLNLIQWFLVGYIVNNVSRGEKACQVTT